MVVKQLGVRTCMHIHTFVFGCRADRQRMGVPYSLEDSSGWPVCCLPAAYTPAIHLLLLAPPLPAHTQPVWPWCLCALLCYMLINLWKQWGQVGGATQSGPKGCETRRHRSGFLFECWLTLSLQNITALTVSLIRCKNTWQNILAMKSENAPYTTSEEKILFITF